MMKRHAAKKNKSTNKFQMSAEKLLCGILFQDYIPDIVFVEPQPTIFNKWILKV